MLRRLSQRSGLQRRAMLRGPFGGSRPWTVLWAVLLGARLFKRVTRSGPDVVFTGTLEPGASLLITAGDREPTVNRGDDTRH